MMIDRIPRGILAAAAALLIALALAARCGHDRAWQAAAVQIRAAELRADSAEAAADTTRLLYSDSVQAVTRRALQLVQERDRLDAALQWERRVTSTLVVALRELRDSAAAVVTVDSADVRHASWHVRQAPWTADVGVQVPAPPDSARLQLAVALDPIAVTVRAGCGRAPAGGGVRPASIAAEGPTWARLELTDVVTDPEVCNPLPQRITTVQRIRIGVPYAAGGAVVAAIATLILSR